MWPIVPRPPIQASTPSVAQSGVCQTNSAGTRDIGVRNTVMYSTMAFGDSVVANDFTISADAAPVAAEASTSRAAGDTASTPGRRITSTPMKPTTVAVQRRRRTTSCSTSAAPTVAKSGAVKLSATASASGINDTAMNQHSMATRPMPARKTCKPSRRVRMAPRPTCASHGTMAITPNRFRKNATSNGCSDVTATRNSPIIAANATDAAIIHNAPRTGAASVSPAAIGGIIFVLRLNPHHR